MKLEHRLYAYIAFIHAVVAAVLIWQRGVLGWWLFPLELTLVVSFVSGLRWVRIALLPQRITGTLPDVIESNEYGARYPRVGHGEIDRVIDAYNGMLATLQRERMRLGEQRGFFERFLAVTPIGILIFDFDRRLSIVNPRAGALLGGPDEPVVGRRLEDIGSGLADALSTLAVDETRMITDSNGRRLRCLRSQFTDRGFIRSYVLIEELTAELNRSERETYEKLIRMMSHEVMNTVAATNSLLASCRNYSDEIGSDEDRADYVNAIDVLITRNRNLSEFTRGFSDLVKLPEPQLEETDVRDLLGSMQTVFRAELAERRIELTIEADARLPPVAMDRNQMDQVLINVIKNAIEAIEGDGRIDIAVERKRNVIVLAIIDTGAGLDAEAQTRLFTPFYTTKKHGQGLGLTLVKEILTQHGFAFSLKPEGGQTCFRIEMPRREEERVHAGAR